MSQPERQLPASPMQLATIVLAIVGLYLLASVVGRVINIVEIKRQQVTLQHKNTELLQDIDRLQKDVQYMQTDSYIEQAARTVLLWGRPGEKLIISSSPAAQATPIAPSQRRP
jgi:cell division protein FtsB